MTESRYGNCFATYGLKSVVVESMICRNPALVQRVANEGGGTDLNDVTMFIFCKIASSLSYSHYLTPVSLTLSSP